MHDLISAKAAQQPETVAVQSWDGSLTYQQVDSYSTVLALDLVERGLGPGNVVPLCFEKSKWAVVALLGVAKSGAAFSLTDPSQPEARLRTIVEQTEATLMITSVSQEDLGRKICSNVLAISAEYFETAPQRTVSLPKVSAEDTMYIIFTSGSTGKPKGVMLSHANYTSGAIPRAEAVGYKSTSRVFDFPSYAFDVSIDCMVCTLACGGCICVPSDAQRMNDLSGAIRESKSNMVHMTPSVARVLDEDIIPSLDVLGLGGEAVGASDAAEWSKHTGLVIAYGPSECTVGCTINNTVTLSTGIGKGVGGVTWIVDPDNHDILMPEGEVGELLVEGPVVGLGYLGEPEKTKEVFIENPSWLSQAGRTGRMYKTGDLVRYESDGRGGIEFVGRKDQQVKLRGQRVELAEVEYHLRTCLPSGVSVAAEVVNQALVAFISPTNHPDLSVALQNIDTAMSKRVPRYMVPAAFTTLDALPSLVSGKIDRKTLRQMGTVNSTAAEKQESIEDETEQKLHEAWISVLGEVSVYRSTNFFSIGGDSLRAMKLVSAARDKGFALTVADIFTYPTLQAMASRLQSADETLSAVPAFSLIDWDAQDARAQAAHLCGLNLADIEDVYTCTPLQEALMALSAKFQEAYIAQRVVEMDDDASAIKLMAAFESSQAKCDILRTRIVQVSDRGLFQVVVNAKPQVHAGDDLQSYLESDRERGMELGDALVRYAVIGKHFVITMHHALYDGWSMPLVVERVNKSFVSESISRPADFKHFIKYLNSVPRQDSEAYWKTQLSGASGVQFPAIPHEGYITVADSLLEEYIPVKQPATSTVANVIRGAWALVASKYIPGSEVVFGETLTGRNAPVLGAAEIEGPMITTVPFRLGIDGEASVGDFLESIKQQTIDQIPHEHFGLQHIRRLSPDALQACELRAGLVLHPRTEEVPNDGPASRLVPAGDAEAAREALKFNTYALMLVCSMDDNGVLVMASFDSNTVDEAVMKNVLSQFHRAMKSLAENPEALLRDVDVLSGQEGLPTGGIFEKDGKLCRYHKGALQVISNNAPQPSQPTPSSGSKSLSSSAKQRQLRKLWSRILRVAESSISPESNFFALGGDSISAMKLASEARAAGLKISVAQMFQNRQLHAMASVLETTSSDKTYTPFSTLQGDIPATVDKLREQVDISGDIRIVDVYPLRPLQRTAVLGTINLPRFSTRYDILTLHDADVLRLKSACQSVMNHHEILRTVFTEDYAIVLDQLDVPFEQHTTDEPFDKFIHSLCEEDIAQPIPAGTSFVKFIHVSNPQDKQSRLVFRISHAQYDEMCLPSILSSFSAFYTNTATPSSVPFSSFVSHTLQTQAQSIPYWNSLLQSSELTLLRPETPVSQPQHCAVEITVDISSRPTDVTIGTIPTAAWALTLSRHKNTRDVVFGEVVSGRSVDFPADNVVGPCWQYVPFRVPFEDSWTSIDLLRFVQDQHTASSAHECLDLGEIADHMPGAWTKPPAFPASSDDDWWFDTVVHQAVTPTTELPVSERVETFYPHQEPLREWKVQAFIAEDGKSMTLEIVTFESWKHHAEGLLDELVKSVNVLVNHHHEKLV